MNSDEKISSIINYVEEQTAEWYKEKFMGAEKSPVFETFKASMMAEIARRIRNRAVEVEDAWYHFTRD